MNRIGIDIGSITIKSVVLNNNEEVVFSKILRHHGEIAAKLIDVLQTIKKEELTGSVCITGKIGEKFFGDEDVAVADFINAEIEGVKKLFPEDVRHILHIGGSSLVLINLDNEQNLVSFSVNSACAAGTGSFLDEQQARLGIGDSDLNLSLKVENPPSIATRCAVFAKSDLIHRQQEGATVPEMWAGLSKGMVDTALHTLLGGRKLSGKTAFTGGVSMNKVIEKYLKKRVDVYTHRHSPFAAAIGAALSEVNTSFDEFRWIVRKKLNSKSDDFSKKRPPLVLKKSKYPDFKVFYESIHNGNEIRVHKDLKDKGEIDVIVGVDIGSTSTKGILIDYKDGSVYADVYRKTEGKPVFATKEILKSIKRIEEIFNVKVNIKGFGTTGSGRKIVGKIFKADVIINEISAHARGTLSVDPSIETIFEIGGQDSKYIRLKNGKVVDSNMNYVCAAGTGSFIEELARKMSIQVSQIGEISEGMSPPITSDRCTVFMEQDAINLLQAGKSKEEVISAILYSIIENYKTKVVETRYVSKDKVFFQGATARNKGLVAAIENSFDVEVVVSPFCHVMGALGTAFFVKDYLEKNRAETSFVGFGILDKNIKFYKEKCTYCTNYCTITYAEVEDTGERVGFGFLCGREESDTKMKINKNFTPIRKRERVFRKYIAAAKGTKRSSKKLGIPLALGFYSYGPFFAAFLNRLNIDFVFSQRTNREIIEHGINKTGADFCFPVKVAHGHIVDLVLNKGVNLLFVPHLLEEEKKPEFTRRRFCPYVESYPSLIKPIVDEFQMELISPVIDFYYDESHNIDSLYNALKKHFYITKEEVREAYHFALQQQRNFEEELRKIGKEFLAKYEAEGKDVIVLIGRPYNTLDSEVCLNLPEKISEYGYPVIYLDMLPLKEDELGVTFNNMYWYYGQKILSGIKYVSKKERLHPVYFTSFNCGPDSFIVHFAERLSGDKPMLVLELDEHGSDGGYLTRIEAFFDVISKNRIKDVKNFEILPAKPSELNGRILWIPPMHPITSRLFAATFRAFGIESKALPETDDEAYRIGKRNSRGAECTPMYLTLGTFINTIRKTGLPSKRHALFMPTATGPCRFGSYWLAQKIILKELGYPDIPVLAPTSENSYLGIPTGARKRVWDAILVGDIIYKLLLHKRPYEINKGETERKVEKWVKIFEEYFESVKSGFNPFPLLENMFFDLNQVEVSNSFKPLVGIVGEIYVRNEPYSNRYVIDAIEKAGGEAWLSGIAEWVLYTEELEKLTIDKLKAPLTRRISYHINNYFIKSKEKKYASFMKKHFPQRSEPEIEDVLEEGLKFLPLEFEGESILTIGRAVMFFKQGAHIVVNAAPFGCMHGHITEALFHRVTEEFKKPVVTFFYDKGTTNENIKSFVNSIKQRFNANKAFVSERVGG